MIHFDCHAHVFEQVVAVPGARYVPTSPAPLQQWLGHLNQQQLKGGVLVQVSFLGTDNSQLCHALQSLDTSCFAGVAVVPLDVELKEIDRLRSTGVRGFRWNLVRGSDIPDLQDPLVRTFLSTVFERGMHIEVHLESERLAPVIAPLLDFGGAVVVDHFGLPVSKEPATEPWLKAIAEARDISNLYVKFSGAYRTGFDISAHAKVLKELLAPERIIWGSDWPHTQYESSTSYRAEVEARQGYAIANDEAAVRSLYSIG
jgi:predicted TIM-barrel fold metal-dependent hydrolase